MQHTLGQLNIVAKLCWNRSRENEELDDQLISFSSLRSSFFGLDDIIKSYFIAFIKDIIAIILDKELYAHDHVFDVDQFHDTRRKLEFRFNRSIWNSVKNEKIKNPETYTAKGKKCLGID